MTVRHALIGIGVFVIGGLLVQAQAPTSGQAPATPQTQAPRRPASPPGTAATQVGGEWVKVERPPATPGGQPTVVNSYQNGKWIEITYNRPIKRQRTGLFGSGGDYGTRLNDGAPVWRAGANQTTRLRTEVPLVFGGKTLPAGEYSVLVDLKENEWTLIFSTWPVQQKYDPNDKTALWGAIGYTSDKDVLRAPMKVQALPFSMDQFTIAFTDVTATGGTLAMMWDTTMASAPFTVGK